MAVWNFQDKTFRFGKYSFTLIEVRDLLISAAVLGLLFSFSNWSFLNFFLSVLIVGPALILHELAHKIVAQRYGLVAAYVMWPTGIAIALLVTFLTGGRFIFAALGAVMITSVYHTRLGYKFIGLTSDQMGKISWAGPMTNIVLAIISYMLMPLNPAFFGLSASINLIIAVFNTVPIPPLDGVKIFRWNMFIWSGTLAAEITLMFLPAYIGLLYSLIITVVIIVALVIWLQFMVPVGQQSDTEYK